MIFEIFKMICVYLCIIFCMVIFELAPLSYLSIKLTYAVSNSGLRFVVGGACVWGIAILLIVEGRYILKKAVERFEK